MVPVVPCSDTGSLVQRGWTVLQAMFALCSSR